MFEKVLEEIKLRNQLCIALLTMLLSMIVLMPS